MTLLIRNVRIIGGEEKFPDGVDVFVSGDRISAIGNFPNKGADEIINGNGAYLAPGFIDVNTDSDHYLSLFDHPDQEDFLRQGVTTIIGGMCGSSLAPLIYGSLESVQKWGDIDKVNIDWAGIGEFLSLLEKKPLAINFATLVGHSTVRRAILGENIRDMTKNELQVFGETLRRGLSEGAFGMSTGLGYVHGHGTPYSELKFLSEIVKASGGVYATHLRNGGEGLGASIDETIKLSRETGVKVLINHLLPIFGFEEEYKQAISEIENLPEESGFHFDIYPSDTSVFTLYTFLPDWVKTGGREVMLEKINDKWTQPRIVKDFPDLNPENFTLAQAPGKEFLIGRTLKELCSIYNTQDYKETLLHLMVVTELRGLVFYKNINYDLVKVAVASPRALIASNAASYPYSGKMLKPERAVSTFTKFLTMSVRDKIMPLETAIKKITADAARKFGIRGRGAVKEGNFADMVVFSVDEKAEFVDQCVSVKAVVVNGKVALRGGVRTKELSGSPLKLKT